MQSYGGSDSVAMPACGAGSQVETAMSSLCDGLSRDPKYRPLLDQLKQALRESPLKGL